MRNKIALPVVVAAIVLAIVSMLFFSSPAYAEGENVFDGDDTIGVTYITHANEATDWSAASSSQLTFANTGFTPDGGAELADVPYVVTLDRYPESGATEWTRINTVSVALPPVSSYSHAGVYQWMVTETSLNLDSAKWVQSSPTYRMTAFIGNSDDPAGLYYVSWYIEQMTDDNGTALVSPEKIDAGYDPSGTSEMDFQLDYIKTQTLSVSKEVEGAFGDKAYAFPIRTTLYLPDWYAAQGQTAPAVMYSDNTQAGVPTWNSSAKTWTLQVTNNLADSQSKTFVVPVGTRYEVREMDTTANGAEYAPSVTWTTEMGVNSITYVSDTGGYAATVARSGNVDGSATIESNPFGRKGMKVTAWNTAPDGVSGTSYEPGDEIADLPSDTTLYATGWEERTYTITFYSTYHHDNEDITGLKYTDTVTGVLDGAEPGRNFKGWSTRKNGQGYPLVSGTTKVSDLIPDDIEGDEITVYAWWSTPQYTVAFDTQGGTYRTPTYDPTQTHRVLTNSGLLPSPAQGPFKDGYVFGGWFRQPNGQGAQLTKATQKLSTCLTIDDTGGTVTFYAYWRHEAILYNANADDATGTIAPSQIDTATGNATVTSDSFTRPGYALTGWNTQADGQGTSYAAGDVIPLSEDMTLYAQWEKVYITVTYEGYRDDVNAGSQVVAQRTVWINDSFEDPNTFNVLGYYHTAWKVTKNKLKPMYKTNLDSSMTVAQVALLQNPAWDGTSDITVYEAIAVRYIVVNEVCVNQYDSTTYTYASKPSWTQTFGQAPRTYTGYTSVGWSVDPNSSTVLPSGWTIGDAVVAAYNAGQISSLDENEITIYGVYEPIDWTVTYDYQYDDLTEDVVTSGGAGYNQFVDRPASRSGYTFRGWNTRDDGTGTWVTSDTHYYECVPDDRYTELILYAQWQETI